MKILAIRGANLASLAGEFEIDLVNGPLGTAGVFAIVGPTGAGKSTLLDAMCVALFDRTPRLTNHSRVVVGRGDDDPTALGAQDVRSLLRRGASAGYAEVDFESGDLRRYRARWSVRRARNATDGRFQSQQVTLTTLDGAGHVIEQLGGTKTETLDAIHERLGLSFDQFRRSALLAQGEFAAFLRADGKDRSELLERMTGTEIYSRLSVAAHLRASLAEQQLRERHGVALAIAVLTDEERARAEADLVLAKDAQVASRTRLTAAETAARWIAEAAQRERALAEAETAQRAARAAVEGAAAERAELALRRRAEALRGTWEETARLDRQLSVARGEAASADQAASRAATEQRDIDELQERLVELHAPIREARISAGLVERPATGAARFGTRARSSSQRGAQVDPRTRMSSHRGASLEDALTTSSSQRGAHSDVPRATSSSDRGAHSDDPRATSSSQGVAHLADARASSSQVDDATSRVGPLARGSAASIAPPKDIEARAKSAVSDATWLLARRDLGPLAATWSELDARLAQQTALAAEIGASDKLLADRARHRDQLLAQRKAASADHQTAVGRLTEAQAEAAGFEKKRGLSLDAARRAEDEARRRGTEVEHLVVIASEARAAVTARTEVDRQLAELAAHATTDAAHARTATTERDEAATLRAERQRMVDELRKAAGYTHARAELVDGDPCPLCGAEEHPWHDRGAFDALILDAQARLADAVSRADAALATLATLAAREAHRAKEKARLAAVRVTTETAITATSTKWRDQLAALGELLLVDDPASDAAAQLAIERTEAAHAKLESARSARSQAEAVAKAATEAQARVQARQADVEHQVHALRNADGALASLDAAVERLRGERAGKLERHGELVDTIEAAFTRWLTALAPEDAARAVVELALDALARSSGVESIVVTHVGAGRSSRARAKSARGSDGAHVGAGEMSIDTHVGAAAQGAVATSARGSDRARVGGGETSIDTHVGANAARRSGTGPDNVFAETSRTHVGADAVRRPGVGPDNVSAEMSRAHEGAVETSTDTHVGANAVRRPGVGPDNVSAEMSRAHEGAVETSTDTHVGAAEHGLDDQVRGNAARGPNAGPDNASAETSRTHVGANAVRRPGVGPDSVSAEMSRAHEGAVETSTGTHVGANAVRRPGVGPDCVSAETFPTHVGANAVRRPGVGPDNVSAETFPTHVGARLAERGLDAHVGALLDRCRSALADAASAWMRHADIVASVDAELGAALATIEQAAREAERVLTDAIARRDTTVARRDAATAELSEAASRLETARITAGFDADELRRLLAEPPTRVELLAQRLEALDRSADRARTLVGERRRHLEEHRAASPLAVDRAGAAVDAARIDQDAPNLTDAPFVDPARIDEPGTASSAAGDPIGTLASDAARVDELAAAVSTADHHAAALAAALAADADARTRRAAALAQHAAAEQAAEIDRVLGEVIGSHDGKLFRSFAQSLTLDGLLAVANSHLEELAPRYQLERVPKHDLELQVIDRDLGNEIRSVQSLSGGESFLVSLALALGLSSMSAHDVRVRTLLIDEGFGTLDPATLDSALAVLDALQATGRQVGVISHVPALVERVGAHVRVYPRGGGKSEVIVADA